MNLKNASIVQIKNILSNHEPKPEGVYKRFSVMVLLFEVDGKLNILFNKRALTLSRQPGEICFPGGSAEGNETPLETALREVNEELGINEKNIEVLGQPDYIITHSNQIIVPFVGFVKDMSPEDIIFSTDEVDSIFTVPLDFFINNQPMINYLHLNPYIKDDFPAEMIPHGRKYKFASAKVPELFYQYEQHIIWGLTARITKNVCNILENEV